MYDTDNEDRMPWGSNGFSTCPVGDRDIMSDEYDMACGRPRCGGGVYQRLTNGDTVQIGGPS